MYGTFERRELDVYPFFLFNRVKIRGDDGINGILEAIVAHGIEGDVLLLWQGDSEISARFGLRHIGARG